MIQSEAGLKLDPICTFTDENQRPGESRMGGFDAASMTTTYIAQAGSLANAVMSFALVQNIAATLALFSSELLRKYVLCAKAGLIYPLVIGGPLLYVMFVAASCCFELDLLPVNDQAEPLRVTAIRLALGRGFFLVMTAAAFIAATLVLRRDAAAAKGAAPEV